MWMISARSAPKMNFTLTKTLIFVHFKADADEINLMF